METGQGNPINYRLPSNRASDDDNDDDDDDVNITTQIKVFPDQEF